MCAGSGYCKQKKTHTLCKCQSSVFQAVTLLWKRILQDTRESTQWALGVWVKGSILQFFIVCISFAFRLHVFSFSLALLCHNLGRSNLSFIKMYMLAIWSKPKSETDLPVGYFIFVFSMRYDAKLYRSKPLNTCSHNPKAFLYFISFFSSMNSSARSWLLWFLLWIWMSAMSTRDAQRMMHTYNPLLLFLISL